MDSAVRVVKLLLLLGHLWTSVTGLRVLLIPINMNSHMIYFSRVAAALSEEGHVVTMLHPSNARLPGFAARSIQLYSYRVREPQSYTNSREIIELVLKLAFSDSQLEEANVLGKIGRGNMESTIQDCEHMFADTSLMQTIKATGYDVAIMDSAGSSCYYSYVYSMGIPYATLSILWCPWYMYRTPALPSFTPNVISGFTDRMTFGQRLQNTLYDAFVVRSLEDIDPRNESRVYYSEKYAPRLRPKSYSDFVRGSILWLSLDDIALSFPKPTMPNIVNVGDVMAVPAEPLPDSLRKYLDEAEHGTILMSFGSYLDFFPEEINKKFCEAFSQLSQRVIWKSKTALCDSPNVLIMPWIPQNDILAHPNLQLFISHGGYNSLIENVNHAVPLIVFPILMDQHYNANLVVSKKYGLRMTLKSFTSEELVNNIKRVLNSHSIRENILKGSSLLTNKLQTPGQRMSYWLTHVVKYGDSHLRSGAFELSWYQFFMIDIYFVFLGFVIVIISSLIGAFWCCLKCFRKRNNLTK